MQDSRYFIRKILPGPRVLTGQPALMFLALPTGLPFELGHPVSLRP